VFGLMIGQRTALGKMGKPDPDQDDGKNRAAAWWCGVAGGRRGAREPFIVRG
jgi:hypothetical protein